MLVKWCWGTLALLHLVPALALFKPELLSTLYGVGAGSVSHTLLHHRAALFLGVVVACLWAAFKPDSRQLAAALVTISMISFLALYAIAGRPERLRVIALADLAGLPFLLFAAHHAFFETIRANQACSH